MVLNFKTKIRKKLDNIFEISETLKKMTQIDCSKTSKKYYVILKSVNLRILKNHLYSFVQKTEQKSKKKHPQLKKISKMKVI